MSAYCSAILLSFGFYRAYRGRDKAIHIRHMTELYWCPHPLQGKIGAYCSAILPRLGIIGFTEAETKSISVILVTYNHGRNI